MSTSKLNDLATRILRSSPIDRTEQKRILRLLNEVRDSLRWTNDRTTVEYLDAATLLISYLAQMGKVGGSEVRNVVARLVHTASQTLSEHGAAKANEAHEAGAAAEAALQGTFPGAQAPTGQVPNVHAPMSAGDPNPSVRLISDMLLGEIMVRQGHIKAEHIEAALQIQRQTGLRFGECLIQLGVTTWEDIQAGLRYQDSCRQVAETFEGSQSLSRKAPPAMPQMKHGRKSVSLHEPGAFPPPVPPPPPPTPGMAQAETPQGPSLPVKPVNYHQEPHERPPTADEQNAARDSAKSGRTAKGIDLRLMSDILLGEILVERQIIQKSDLDRALETQRATGMRLGEALQANGACTWDQIQIGLSVQGQMRRYISDK